MLSELAESYKSLQGDINLAHEKLRHNKKIIKVNSNLHLSLIFYF